MCLFTFSRLILEGALCQTLVFLRFFSLRASFFEVFELQFGHFLGGGPRVHPWSLPGGQFESLGGLLGSLLGLPGPPRDPLGTLLGPPWGHLGLPFRPFGSTLAPLGAAFGAFGNLFAPMGLALGCFRGI